MNKNEIHNTIAAADRAATAIGRVDGYEPHFGCVLAYDMRTIVWIGVNTNLFFGRLDRAAKNAGCMVFDFPVPRLKGAGTDPIEWAKTRIADFMRDRLLPGDLVPAFLDARFKLYRIATQEHRDPSSRLVSIEAMIARAATGSTPGIHTGADHDGDGIP